MKRKTGVKAIRGEKNTNSLREWVSGNKVTRNFWKVSILKINVHHYKHSQCLCKSVSDLSWKRSCNSGSCDRRTRKLDAMELKGSRTETTSMPLFWIWNKSKHRCNHIQKLQVSVNSAGGMQWKNTGSTMMQHIVLAWLAKRSSPRTLEWTIPLASEGNPKQGIFSNMLTEPVWYTPYHCLLQDLDSEHLLVLNLHFMPFMKSIFVHCFL